jgi:hypothetical protein
MRTTRCYGSGLLLGLCCLLGGVPATASESGHLDQEAALVKDGVLGTVNVLRELDVKTWKNRVTVTCNVKGKGDQPEWRKNVNHTIDGSGLDFAPEHQGEPAEGVVFTYILPALRTVSSLAIVGDAPDTLRLEGSTDGGKIWFEVLKSKPRKESVFLKCFKPVKVTQLRLNLKGGGDRVQEVFVYADAEAPLPFFGGKDSGTFSFLRDLWYAGKIKLCPSPMNAVWTSLGGGKSFAMFQSDIVNSHDGALGAGVPYGAARPDKRLYLRFDLDNAYPMNFGLISTDAGEGVLARTSRAEFYTANGRLDPSTLAGSSTKDITGQGWILQKAWDKDANVCKNFPLARPSQYNQMLLVWDCVPGSSSWSHLEMFGVETPDAGGASKNPQK